MKIKDKQFTPRCPVTRASVGADAKVAFGDGGLSPMRSTVGSGGPEITPNYLAILLGLRGRCAISPETAVSKYALRREDKVGPNCGDMAEQDPPLIGWVEQPKSPVPKITKSKWTLWITEAGLKTIDNHVLLTGRKAKGNSP